MELVSEDENTSKKQTDNQSEIKIECKTELWKKSQVTAVWCWGRWRDSPCAGSGSYEGELTDVNEENCGDEKCE